MSGPVEIVVIIAAVCYVMVRRWIGEPAEGKRMLLLPVVLGAVGLSDLSGHVKGTAPVAVLVATVAISVLFGALRGVSVRLSTRDGVVFVHYTAVTIGLWVLNLAAKFGANLLFAGSHAADALSNSLLLTLGAGLLAEGLVVLARSVRTDSRVIWSAGKDGRPHTRSPFLDGLQDRLADPARDGRPTDRGSAYQDTWTGPSGPRGTVRDSMLNLLRDSGARRDHRD